MEYRGLEVKIDPSDTWKGIPTGIIRVAIFGFILVMSLAVWANWDEISSSLGEEPTKACSMGPVGHCWEIQPTTDASP